MSNTDKAKKGFLAHFFRGKAKKDEEDATSSVVDVPTELTDLSDVPPVAEDNAKPFNEEEESEILSTTCDAIDSGEPDKTNTLEDLPEEETLQSEVPALSPLLIETSPERLSWWQRLTRGLGRTSSSLSTTIFELFSKRKLDSHTLEDLEDALIQADLGLEAAAKIAQRIGAGRFDKHISPEEVRQALAQEVETLLTDCAQPLTIDKTKKPFVILMTGVNGAGKTTTIGKLASKFQKSGLKVMLAAGDTFRAAAIEQLKVWGQRNNCPVIAHNQGADAAGLAFDALKAAQEQDMDVLLIDTAGRLQNKSSLMGELEKIVRVLKKLDAEAPHACLLVLDATVGQNALSQVETFGKTAGVTGLIMTKLDGTARGGILVALAAKFALPIHFIGVGEAIDDLEPFSAHDFACAIAGIDKQNN